MSRSVAISMLMSFMFIFAGCSAIGTKRIPVQNITINQVNINKDLQDTLLKEVLRESFSKNDQFYLKDTCLKTYEKFRSTGEPALLYCYKFSENTLTASYGGFFGGGGLVPKKFITPLKEARNKVEKGFNERYIKKVNNYLKFKKEYLSFIDEFKNKANNLQIKTIDTTKTLPSGLLTTIGDMNNNKSKISLEGYAVSDDKILNIYKNFSKNYKEELAQHVLYKNPVVSLERYQFSYDNIVKEKSWNFEQLPKKFNLNINNVLFNFMPEKINAADYNIAVSIDTSSSRNNVTIQNGLKKFITINTISIYYNGQIESREIHLKIPPLGIFKTSFSVNKSNRHIALKSKNQKVEVGTAIEYTIVDTGEKKSLYKTKKLSQFDF